MEDQVERKQEKKREEPEPKSEIASHGKKPANEGKKEITSESSKEDDQAKLKKKRRLDYIKENPASYTLPYVKKWLSQTFLPTLRDDINFYSFLNHNELKVPTIN